MKTLPTIVGSMLLLAVAAFCLFGFLATYEPTDKPGLFMAFRVSYAVAGSACLTGIVALFVKAIRKSKSARW